MKLNSSIMKKESINNITDVIKSEYGEDTKVVVSTIRNYPKNIPDFVMLFQAITEQLVLGLAPASCKLLLYMFGKLQYSNHIGVDQKTMSEELGVTTRTIAQSIKELTEAKILIVYNDIQDKRRNVYIINPHQAWKGTFKERTKKMAQLNLNQTKLIL